MPHTTHEIGNVKFEAKNAKEARAEFNKAIALLQAVPDCLANRLVLTEAACLLEEFALKRGRKPPIEFEVTLFDE